MKKKIKSKSKTKINPNDMKRVFVEFNAKTQECKILLHQCNVFESLAILTLAKDVSLNGAKQ